MYAVSLSISPYSQHCPSTLTIRNWQRALLWRGKHNSNSVVLLPIFIQFPHLDIFVPLCDRGGASANLGFRIAHHLDYAQYRFSLKIISTETAFSGLFCLVHSFIRASRIVAQNFRCHSQGNDDIGTWRSLPVVVAETLNPERLSQPFSLFRDRSWRRKSINSAVCAEIVVDCGDIYKCGIALCHVEICFQV